MMIDEEEEEPVVFRRVGEGGVTEMMEAEEGWRREEAGMGD